MAELIHDQNRSGVQKGMDNGMAKDGSKQPDGLPGTPVKGKPRLLLMGQRRYVMLLKVAAISGHY